MGLWNRKSLILMSAAFVACAGAAAWAASDLILLPQLEKGRWILTERGQSAPFDKICLGDPAALLKPEHRTAKCSQYVIENTPDRVTIHYRCPGVGHGHTMVRRETNRLVQIETQGINQGQPFDRSIEARRVGSCTR